jgi:hypothetical protein
MKTQEKYCLLKKEQEVNLPTNVSSSVRANIYPLNVIEKNVMQHAIILATS